MKPVVALDIETTGLDAWRDKITIRGLFDGKQYSCLRHPEQLRNLLGTVYKDYDIVGHRTDFDLKFVLVQNEITDEVLNGRTIHDTRILGSLLKNRVPKAFLDQYEVQRKALNKTLPKGQSHREGSPLSLKTMAPWYLKVPPFWETPGNHDNEEYNEKDCLYTWRLFHKLAPLLMEEGSWDFYLKLLQWQQMLMKMEMRGISIDIDELDKVEKEYLEKRSALRASLDKQWSAAREKYRLEEEIRIRNQYWEMQLKQQEKIKSDDPKLEAKSEKIFNRYEIMAQKCVDKIEDLNYSSPTQMTWLLRDYLGLDITDPEGEESTGKAVLHKLAAEGREDIKTFLDWREADKVLTMYLPTYRSLQVDGIIHPNFNITGTRTGRTSSSGPNLQQVPSKLYRLFIPRSGYKFIQYDLSGIEAALIALYSGDKRLYEILERGDSIHDHNARALFGLSCDTREVAQLFPRERKCAKTIGFACFYGAGWRRIKLAFQSAGFILTEKEAKEKLAALKSYYPEAFAFHKEITETFERGETVLNILGRPINLQEHENPYMQGFNSLIQSSASDLNLEGCYRFYTEDEDAPEEIKFPLAMIHDFNMAEVWDDYAKHYGERLKHHMTNFNLESVNGKIQLRVEGGVSDRWEK